VPVRVEREEALGVRHWSPHLAASLVACEFCCEIAFHTRACDASPCSNQASETHDEQRQVLSTRLGDR
jgi:hypothetical protein